MNPRILLALASSMRLQQLVDELTQAENAARVDFGIATLTSMEIPTPAAPLERAGEENEQAFLQALDRDIAAALERAQEAETRWTAEELEKFRTVTDRVNEHLRRIGNVWP
jgi:chromosome segregation ATPase